DLSRIERDRSSVAEEVKDIISKRLDAYGLKEISISVQGEDHIVVQLPGSDTQSVEELKMQIERAGSLTFRLVLEGTEYQGEDRLRELEAAERAYIDLDKAWVERKLADPTYNEQRPKPPEQLVRSLVEKEMVGNKEVYRPLPGGKLVLQNYTQYDPAANKWEPVGSVSGRYLTGVQSSFDQERMRPAVGFQLGGEGASAFADLTGANVGKKLAIVLDEDVMSAPNIESRISTNGQITGEFTDDEVRGLVTILRGGSLPTKPILISESTVGSVLGQDSIAAAMRAVAVGAAGVMLFMAAYYLAAGLVADFALALNLLFIMSFVVCFRQTLTLPGIAGILLTLGMAVDANVLIFERFREERRKGKNLTQSLGTAYHRAFSVIFDSNLTTIITGYVLFYMGTGPVKGFAVTLIAGIFATFFTSVFVTRLILSLLASLGILKDLKMVDVFPTPRVPFVRYQQRFIMGSVVVIALTWVLVLWRGKANYGIDFTGGARVVMTLKKPLRVEEMREKINLLADKEPELFRDYTVQTLNVEEEGVSRSFALLTRAGQRSGGSRTARAQEPAKEEAKPPVPPVEDPALPAAAQPAAEMPEAPPGADAPTAPAPAAVPAPAGAEIREGSLEEDLPSAEPAQLVRQALQDLLEMEDLLLPPPFPTTRWEPVSDALARTTSYVLSMEVNLIESGAGVTPDQLKDQLDLRLAENPLLSTTGRDPVAAYRGVAIQSVELKEKPEAEGGVSRYLVRTTPFEPQTLVGLGGDRAIPTRLQAEEAIRGFFRQGSPAELFRISEPFPQVSTVGPRVASSLQADAVVAIFISILGIIFYLSLRFEFNYALAGIAALAHDVLVAIGIMAVTDHFLETTFPVKFNLNELAAILTIIGFSINDTIVLFDRVRENQELLAKKRLPLRDLLDISVNQTLSRTIWTATTVFIVTVILLGFGGESIRGFAYLFTVGIVAGTYSTVFVAAPVAIWLNDRAVARRKALEVVEA
ncbi:MAG TPA: protein translocase subunit SecD, partial [Planctomycetota bacterium]|nr:protein translocase subunit SecD [Planctomycetota bacterium]